MVALLTNIARVEAVRPPAQGSAHFADDPALLVTATNALAAASQWFEGRVGRDITSQARDYVLSGNGSRALSLRGHWPITAVASVSVCNVAWVQLLFGGVLDGTDYFIHDTGRWLEATWRPWTKGHGNIQVAATTGFSAIPDDAQQVVAMAAWLLYNESLKLGSKEVRLGDVESIVNARAAKGDYEFIKHTVDYYGRVW